MEYNDTGRSPTAGFWDRWGLSTVLLATYIVLFHLWNSLPSPSAVRSTGSMASLFLVILGSLPRHRRYWVNPWDAIMHSLVVLDIVLESWLIPNHSGWGFYWCALGFLATVGGYRYGLLRGDALSVHRSVSGRSHP